MKLLFLILAGGGDEHKKDESTQRETWANNQEDSPQVLWIRSGNQLRHDSKNRILFVPCKEHELLLKSIIATKWSLSNLDFDVIVRTNVSTFFREAPLLHKLVDLKFDFNSFGGYLQFAPKVPKATKKNFFISGTGIFLGKKAATMISTMEYEEWKFVPDDLAISEFLLSHSELNLTSIPRCTLSNHHFFLPHYFFRCKTSWNPALASKRMKSIYSFYAADTGLESIWRFLNIYISETIYCRKTIENFYNYLIRIRVEIRELMLNYQIRSGNLHKKRPCGL